MHVGASWGDLEGDLGPLDRRLGSLEALLEPPGALLGASCLPFPLRRPWSDLAYRWPTVPWGSKIWLKIVAECVGVAFLGSRGAPPC